MLLAANHVPSSPSASPSLPVHVRRFLMRPSCQGTLHLQSVWPQCTQYRHTVCRAQGFLDLLKGIADNALLFLQGGLLLGAVSADMNVFTARRLNRTQRLYAWSQRPYACVCVMSRGRYCHAL